jgi:DNA-binding MarR family transcriptional regulator
MWYTYCVAGEEQQLYELDDLLAAVRLAVQRPEYRRRLLQGLDIPGGITTLRLLRAVEILSGSGTPSIKDVAARLAVEHSTASRGVDSVVRAGLLSRQPCVDDQRRTRLTLTAQGRSLLRRTAARRRELLEDVTEDWPTEDVARLIELLDALRAGFDRLEQPK